MLYELKENAKWLGVGALILVVLLILPFKISKMVGGFIMSIKNAVFPENVGTGDQNIDDVVDGIDEYYA